MTENKKPEPIIVSPPKVDKRPDRYCSICKKM